MHTMKCLLFIDSCSKRKLIICIGAFQQEIIDVRARGKGNANPGRYRLFYWLSPVQLNKKFDADRDFVYLEVSDSFPRQE